MILLWKGSSAPVSPLLKGEGAMRPLSSVLALEKIGMEKISQPLVKASYKVAYNIMSKKKHHTIAKNLIKPCFLEMVVLVIGKKQKDKITEIPFSSSTILNWINDISVDVF